jgi:surface antigen
MAPVLAGCSLSLPIFGDAARDDDERVEATASLSASAASLPKKPLAVLEKELGPEDMRRAMGAMAIALDPQGNGSSVNWSNPESGLKGLFSPVGSPFPSDDVICRSFLSGVTTQSQQLAFQGTACRPSGGEWTVRDFRPWKRPT